MSEVGQSGKALERNDNACGINQNERFSRMTRATIGLALLLSLSGCGWIGDTFARFGGGPNATMPYRASVNPGDDPRDLVVTVVAAPDVTLDEMRESARFAVTRYCIRSYGSSDADWAFDAASGDWAVTRTERTALLQARCTGR